MLFIYNMFSQSPLEYKYRCCPTLCPLCDLCGATFPIPESPPSAHEPSAGQSARIRLPYRILLLAPSFMKIEMLHTSFLLIKKTDKKNN